MARNQRVGPRVVALRACGCLAALLLSLALVVGGGVAYVATRDQDGLESAERKLAARVAIARRRRWTRPVLRGQAIAGNAATAHRAALAALGPNIETLPLEAFGALREATRRTYAATPPSLSAERLADDDAAAEREHDRVVTALARMIEVARAADPTECLAACADAVRIAQDRVPGQPVDELLHVMPTVMLHVADVLPRCALAAPSDARTRAMREMTVLARHPAPTGWAFEVRLLRDSVGMLAGAHDWPGILGRPRAVDAASYNLGFAAAYAAMMPADYPASFAPVERDAIECPRRSGASACRDERPDVFVDATQQALLRALAIGLSALVETPRDPAAEVRPALLDDPAMRDPFAGTALRFVPVAVAPDGASGDAPRAVRIYSVGVNGTDDAGDAPLDVSVTFVLGAPPG